MPWYQRLPARIFTTSVFSDHAVGGIVVASPRAKVRPRVLPSRDRMGAHTSRRGAGTDFKVSILSNREMVKFLFG